MSISPERKAALEAASHRAALSYVERLTQDRVPLGQVELREIHRLIFQDSWPDIAGRYRTHAVEITGTSYHPPHWRHVPTLMYQILDALNDRVRTLSADDVSGIVELAAQAHYDVIRIHPFRDGNGRVARLVMNYVFLYFDLPYVIIPHQAREQYLDALEAANRGDFSRFIHLIAQQYDRALDIALGLSENAQSS